MNWYMITSAEGGHTRNYIGVSAFSEQQMADALAKPQAILLEQLTTVSNGGELKTYSEDWEPHSNRVWLNPRHIAAVVPLRPNWQEFRASWEASLLSRMERFLKGE